MACLLFKIDPLLHAYFAKHNMYIATRYQQTHASKILNNNSNIAIDSKIGAIISPPLSNFHVNKTSTDFVLEGRAASVSHWRRVLLSWAIVKTVGLGGNLGFSIRTDTPASMGSNIVLDLQPFFPFGKGRHGKKDITRRKTSKQQIINVTV
jgi:hypothetical protein